MKSKFFILMGFLLLALAILPFMRSRPASLDWHRDKDEAFQTARATHKPVLAFLYADWCTYCRQMDSTTFRDPHVIKDLGRRFVWLRLNAETNPEGADLQRRFGVEGYPTLLILDESGNEIERLSGFVPPDQFPERLQALVDGPDSFPGLEQRLEENPDSAEVNFKIASKYLERKQFQEAGEHFGRAVALDPENQSGLADDGLYYIAGTEAMLGQVDKALATLKELRTRFPQSDYSTESSLMRAQLLIQNGEDSEARKVLTQFLHDHPDHRAAAQVRQLLDRKSF